MQGIETEFILDNSADVSEWSAYNELIEDETEFVEQINNSCSIESNLLSQPMVNQLQVTENHYKLNSLVKICRSRFIENAKFIDKMREKKANDELNYLRLEEDTAITNESKQVKLEKILLDSLPLLNKESNNNSLY